MTEKAPKGRWTPGKSGNPAGRRPGTGEVSRLRASISEHVPSILKKLADMAKGGDVGAARLLLERAIAPHKSVEESVTLTMPTGSLTDQGRAVLDAVACGLLPPSQGASLMASIAALAKLAEADELERRIKALEERATKEGTKS